MAHADNTGSELVSDGAEKVLAAEGSPPRGRMIPE